MNERDVQRRLVAALRRYHWIVTVFSMPHSVKQQVRDFVDVLAVRWDHTWFLECKGPTGKPTEGQLRFRHRIKQHSGPHVDHAFVYPWDELDAIVSWGAECKPHGLSYPPKEKT